MLNVDDVMNLLCTDDEVYVDYEMNLVLCTDDVMNLLCTDVVVYHDDEMNLLCADDDVVYVDVVPDLHVLQVEATLSSGKQQILSV